MGDTANSMVGAVRNVRGDGNSETACVADIVEDCGATCILGRRTLDETNHQIGRLI